MCVCVREMGGRHRCVASDTTDTYVLSTEFKCLRANDAAKNTVRPANMLAGVSEEAFDYIFAEH